MPPASRTSTLSHGIPQPSRGWLPTVLLIGSLFANPISAIESSVHIPIFLQGFCHSHGIPHPVNSLLAHEHLNTVLTWASSSCYKDSDFMSHPSSLPRSSAMSANVVLPATRAVTIDTSTRNQDNLTFVTE